MGENRDRAALDREKFGVIFPSNLTEKFWSALSADGNKWGLSGRAMKNGAIREIQINKLTSGNRHSP